MGEGRRENKEKASEGRGRVKYQVEEVFNHFGKDVLYEKQLFGYFMKKGMIRKEVERLIVDAISIRS